MYIGSWNIDNYLTFVCNTHAPSTGAAQVADAAPSYRIYEDETTASIVTGNLATLDNVNTVGLYSERVQLLEASGFEKGKTYSIYIGATVDGTSGTMSHTFQIESQIASAVWDEPTSGHVTSGTFGNHVGKKLLSVAKFLGLK